ncbi:HAD family hydrolase [Butyrivibrio sp. CB08]|uniref:HAD family hydrolase n=1 Tax=Butyrivibrio sp. CB08 TaxID=2364879 RepID=UPI000EAA0F77|nr:HAD family hydrolase [Butyrivibrio sp. CB08]RKM61969.1 HAD family hydrolase [Butyrivibrio sp. CB08]
MTFDNYIFDLYGTLIDIHTDEELPGLWQDMAAYLEYQFKASYSAKELRKRYLEICAEEEQMLKEWLSKNAHIKTKYPEIRISWVWTRLIAEKIGQYSGGKEKSPSSYLPHKYDEEEYITPQMQAICTYFRNTSRDKLIKYSGVDHTLRELQRHGKKIFLLSNAQKAFTVKELMACDLFEFFNGIFISSDRMVKKPEPAFMDGLVSKFGLDKSKCVMIGNDITSDVGVAAASGIRSIFLNTYDVTDSQINDSIKKLNIKNKDLYPVIIQDGSIEKILSL